MKKIIIILLATVLPSAAMAASANDEREEAKDDTTFVYKGKQVIVSDSDGYTRVRVYDKANNEYKPYYEGRFSDMSEEETFYINTVFAPDLYRQLKGRYYPLVPAFYAEMGTVGSGAMSFSNNKALHLRGIGTVEMGLSLFSIEYSEGKRGWGFTHTIDGLVGDINLKKGWGLSNDADYEVSATSQDPEKYGYVVYIGGRMREMAHYLLPVGNDRIGIGMGFSFEYREMMVSYMAENKNKAHRDALSADINMRRFGFGLDFQLSYSGWFMYAHKSLTPMLRTKHSPKAYPFTMGIGFTF